MKNQRKKFLIDPKFQIFFLSFSLATGILVSVIFMMTSAFFLKQVFAQAEAQGLPKDHVFFDILRYHEHMTVVSVIISTLIVLTILSYYSFYMSNRVAGPIYRLKMKLREYCDGKDFQEINIREHDLFPELADVINEAIIHTQNNKK